PLPHRVVDAAGLVAGDRVAAAFGPFVHVEGGDVVALGGAKPQATNDGLVHDHRPDGQNDRELAPLAAGRFDDVGDGVAHRGADLGDGGGAEILVPVPRGRRELPEVHAAAAVDAAKIPAARVKAVEARAADGIEHAEGFAHE